MTTIRRSSARASACPAGGIVNSSGILMRCARCGQDCYRCFPPAEFPQPAYPVLSCDGAAHAVRRPLDWCRRHLPGRCNGSSSSIVYIIIVHRSEWAGRQDMSRSKGRNIARFVGPLGSWDERIQHYDS